MTLSSVREVANYGSSKNLLLEHTGSPKKDPKLGFNSRLGTSKLLPFNKTECRRVV
jgi:hypothetical protein